MSMQITSFVTFGWIHTQVWSLFILLKSNLNQYHNPGYLSSCLDDLLLANLLVALTVLTYSRVSNRRIVPSKCILRKGTFKLLGGKNEL